MAPETERDMRLTPEPVTDFKKTETSLTCIEAATSCDSFPQSVEQHSQPP